MAYTRQISQHSKSIKIDDDNTQWLKENAKNCGITVETYLSHVAQHKYQRLRYNTTMHNVAIHIYNLNRNMSPFMPMINALAEHINNIATYNHLNHHHLLININVERQLIYIYGEKTSFNIIETELQEQYEMINEHLQKLFDDARQQQMSIKDIPLQPFEAFCYHLLQVYHWQCKVSYKKKSEWIKQG